MTIEGPDVQQTTQLRINWLNVNVPTILAVLAAAISIVSYFDDMSDRLSVIEDYRVVQERISAKNFSDLETKLNPLTNVPDKINALQAADIAINTRIDRLADTIIEALRKDISQVGVKVEVLTTKQDNLAAKVEQISEKVDRLNPVEFKRIENDAEQKRKATQPDGSGCTQRGVCEARGDTTTYR